MTKFGKILFLVILIFVLVIVFYFFKKEPVEAPMIENKIPVEDVTQRDILGNKDDLISFSIAPNSVVHDGDIYEGVIQGGYFFEGNILINILDKDKNLILKGNTEATSEWMTTDPVSFEGILHISELKKGPAYIEIHNDNPSDIRENDKSVLIPVIFE